MCLVKENIFPQRAKEDIVVWKIVDLRDNGELYTAVVGHHIKLGETVKPTSPWWTGIFRSIIEGECVHSFKDYPISYQISDLYRIQAIVKCIIPKGSYFWISTDKVTIASSRLVIDSIEKMLPKKEFTPSPSYLRGFGCKKKKKRKSKGK